MSYRPEVQTDSTGEWYSNALRFETEAEAFRSAEDLAMRWTLVHDYRAAESSDPVTHRIIDDRLERIGE